MSSEWVQAWLDLSRETCEEQEVEMDIIWNKENFMAARRPPHTTTSSEAIYLSPCQLCDQQRLFNLDASEKLAWDRRQVFPFNKLHCVLNLDEFGSSMTRSFKRNMWRAGSGDGHHMEQREFHGGSAAATHNDQLWSHLSQPVSATNRGCSISTLQKNLRETADNSFHFISCTAFWIWMNLVQVWQDLARETCEEQEVEMDIIWNKENFMVARRPPHTTTSSEAIYLSPCQLCNQQRLFNLDASEKLAWDTADNSFHFHRCTTFWIWWIWVKYDKSFQEKHVKSRKWRWTSYGMKRISWRLGSPHTAKSCNAVYLSPCQPAATVRLHHWFGQPGNQTEVG